MKRESDFRLEGKQSAINQHRMITHSGLKPFRLVPSRGSATSASPLALLAIAECHSRHSASPCHTA